MINTTIRTEQDYEAALLRIESLMMAEANTPEADELEVLATLVELYQKAAVKPCAFRPGISGDGISDSSRAT
jgi:antitoxin component HigA of HigAB toxin-antitoxin module